MKERTYKDALEPVKICMEGSYFASGCGNTGMSIKFMEGALFTLFFLTNSPDSETEKLLESICENLEGLYLGDLIEKSGCGYLGISNMLEEKDNPLVKEYRERTESLSMLARCTHSFPLLSPQRSRYLM